MRRSKVFILLPLLFLMQGCLQKKNAGGEHRQTARSPEEISVTADSLAHAIIIVDGHTDLPYWLHEHPGEDVSKRLTLGHFDYVRAKEGGLDALFAAVFTPSSYENNGARAFAISLIDLVEKLVKEHPGKFALARTPDQVRANFRKGLISLPMGMENGSPIEGDLQNLKFFFDRGIRYITLTHAKDNHICDSSYDTTRTWNGLSPFGYQVVKEMNRLGLMIDVSHVSDSAFYQVMRTTQAPVIASHSGCRHFTPGMERNMSDDMIREMGKKGGIVMVNFGSYFLTREAHEALMEVDKWLDSTRLSRDDPKTKAYIAERFKGIDLYGSVKNVADHIDRIVQLAGIDHVGIGSDFDGVGTLPAGLKDVAGYPNLIGELLKRGYTPEEIQKICSGNLFRVWNEVLQNAGKND